MRPTSIPMWRSCRNTVEGGIHRYGYASLARTHRQAGQRPDRPRHQAGRPGRDAGLERLPPFRALLCHRRHRRGLPHHQSAAVSRADHLHRQPCRRHGAVLRSHLPAAGREAEARAQDHQDLHADDRPRAHARQRSAQRPAVLRGTARRNAERLRVAGVRRERRLRALLHVRHHWRAQGRALFQPLDAAAHVLPDRHAARICSRTTARSCRWCRCSTPMPGACPTSRR